MIAALKPYEEYKETGLSWAPIIPKHWEIRPAFGAFAPNYDRNDGMKVKTVLSLSYGRIIIKPADKLRGLVPESFETYQIVNPGYIVLRTTDLQNDHNSLRVGIVKDRGIITSAYLALRTSAGVTPEYGFQFLNVWDSTKAIYGYGSGLRQNLDFSHFKRMPVSVPPPEEQEAIVRFLDHAHGRIDRAIRAKRKVIALLNEQKQAIIHKAVTRGLNPDAPLKPSGISWLGDIPAHWEIRPAFGAFAPNHERNEGMKEKTVLSLSYGRIIIKPAEKLRGLVPESFETYQIVNPGYIILRTTDLQNDHNSLRVGIVKDRGIITSAYLALRTSAGVAPEYGFQFLNVWDSSKAIYGYGSGLRQNLEFSHFRRMPVAVPPPEEQESIVLFISQQASPIERRIGVLSNEIDLLREYRTCLTADVVTGKLDVREAAKSLPSESPETHSENVLPDPDLEGDEEQDLEEVEG
jgi:type I restriction enzyme S subunit